MESLYIRIGHKIFRQMGVSHFIEADETDLEYIRSSGVDVIDFDPNDAINMVLKPSNLIQTTPYVAIEGPDGIGKTTFIMKLYEYLINKGIKTIAIKEPGYTKAGAYIRQAIMKNELTLQEEMELFLADRLMTQNLVVRPALKQNKIVISDRTVISSMVYQGLVNHRREDKNQGRSLEAVRSLHNLVPNFIWPNKVLVGQLPVEVALERLQGRKEESNRFDQASIEYHTQVHGFFNTTHEWSRLETHYLDFSLPLEELLEAAYKAIMMKPFSFPTVFSQENLP